MAIILALWLSGCPMRVPGYRPISGRVIDAPSGRPLSDARVTACLVDAHPSSDRKGCNGAVSRVEVDADDAGLFRVPATHRWGLMIPLPDGIPVFKTNLLVEAPGYEARELDWARDHDALDQGQLTVELEARSRRSENSAGSRSE
jgi:hypothetical protein